VIPGRPRTAKATPAPTGTRRVILEPGPIVDPTSAKAKAGHPADGACESQSRRQPRGFFFFRGHSKTSGAVFGRGYGGRQVSDRVGEGWRPICTRGWPSRPADSQPPKKVGA